MIVRYFPMKHRLLIVSRELTWWSDIQVCWDSTFFDYKSAFVIRFIFIYNIIICKLWNWHPISFILLFVINSFYPCIGAGTVLDVLRLGKPLLVVTNESLMNNHQEELANKLKDENYLHSCTIKDLPQAIESFDQHGLRPFPPPKLDIFPMFLDSIFNFS